MNTRLVIRFVLVVSAIACVAEPQQAPQEDHARKQFDVAQASMDQAAKATEERYGRMSVEELTRALEQEAEQGREPFNSPAFREVVKRRDAASQVLASIKTSTRKEYFKLMALKRLDAAAFVRVPPDQGAAILADALARSETFNGWGIPGFYWESSARAIIEYGPNAVPHIEPLLKDKRLAPVWGSEEALISAQYQFRVCDYALALLNAINGKDSGALPQLPADRDRLVEAYRR
jgi:hypothetical protein